MKKYKVIFIVVLLVFLASLVGCSSGAQQGSETAQDEPVEVAYIQMNLTAAYYLEMQKGFEEAERRLNVNLDVLDSDHPVIGSIALKGDSFIQKVRERNDIELIHVSEKNRDNLTDLFLLY